LKSFAKNRSILLNIQFLFATVAPPLDGFSEITLEAVSSIGQIPAGDWDACANSDGTYNPFVTHAFFAALETSGSAVARTGWAARHLIARIAGQVVGVVPCYLKNHSQGEYVFDHGWADAYARAGGSYYPKLQASVPSRPRPDLACWSGKATTERVREHLAAGLIALCGATQASSVHVTFAHKDEWTFLAKQGFLQRTDQQFHWHNEGYGTFEDFLATLASRHRKAIRRERRDALADGITITP
jgi:predicted N-acyltransferase